MDLDLMERGRPSKPRNSRFKGKPMDLEREKRKKENLCYSCGKSGHRAKECKSRPKELHVIEKTGIGEQKADTPIIPQRKNWVKARDLRAPGTQSSEGMTAQKDHHPKGQSKAGGWIEVRDMMPEERQKHAMMSWTGCYDDHCPIHKSDKDGAGWYPQNWKGKAPRRNVDVIAQGQYEVVRSDA